MTRRGGLALTLLAATLAASAAPPPSLTVIEQSGRKLRPLMRAKVPVEFAEKPKGPPELPQSFADYLASNPNRPTRGRPKIYVLPVGELSAAETRLLREAETFLGLAYGTPIVTLDAVPDRAVPPPIHWTRPNWGSDGYRAGHFAEFFLGPRRPKDAVALLGVTSSTLWTGEGLKIVFGRASYTAHVAGISLGRLGNPDLDWIDALRRTLKVTVHETAHTLGLIHCQEFECGLNASDSRAERDNAPLAFCSECEMKVCWACGLDPLTRTKALFDYCEASGLEPEAADYRRRWLVLGGR